MVNGLPISVFILDSIFFGLELFVQFSEVFTVASYFKIVVKFSLLKTKQKTTKTNKNAIFLEAFNYTRLTLSTVKSS